MYSEEYVYRRIIPTLSLSQLKTAAVKSTRYNSLKYLQEVGKCNCYFNRLSEF